MGEISTDALMVLAILARHDSHRLLVWNGVGCIFLQGCLSGSKAVYVSPGLLVNK